MDAYQSPVALEFHRTGNEQLVEGHFEKAVSCYDKAVAAAPALAAAWCNRGVALHELGRFIDALHSYHQALSINPRDATSWLNCGNTLRAMGYAHDALSSFQQALQLSPDDAHALYARGSVLIDLHRPEDALADLCATLRVQPKWPDVHLSYGSALMDLHRYQEALVAFTQALHLSPESARAHFNCGCAMNALQRPREALACFDRAYALGDRRAEVHLNRGYALSELDRWGEAADSFEDAVRCRPESAPAWSNLGLALERSKAFDASRECHQRALAIHPDYAAGRYNLSFLQLRLGEYEEGFRNYEARWATADFERRQRHPQLPLWSGQPLPTGIGLLVFAEQGFGDTIQFSRYVAELARQGIRVIFQVPERLVKLFQDQWPLVTVLSDGAALPANVAARCPLMSLPHILGTTLQRIPSVETYLQPELPLVQEWVERVERTVGGNSHPRVGLMWRGGDATRYRNRSLAWRSFRSVLKPGFTFLSLQKDLAAEEAEGVLGDGRIHHFGDKQRCFADAAALIKACDLVITVDTSVAHLSGALGQRTWVLLPYDADWRWLEGRNDSPWYSSMRLYRQGPDAQWGPVIERVGRDLVQSRFSSS